MTDMPFGMGAGEAGVFLLAVLAFWGVPLIAVIWALVTLARVRSDQKEILAKLAAMERTTASARGQSPP